MKDKLEENNEASCTLIFHTFRCRPDFISSLRSTNQQQANMQHKGLKKFHNKVYKLK